MNKKVLISLILSIIFIILSFLVIYDKTIFLDNKIYNLITYNITDNITLINKCFTFLGSTLFIIFLTVFFFIFFLFRKKKNCSFVIAFVIIISTVFNNVVKLIIRRKRPEVLALVIEKSFSFPSGHTMASVSLYGILIYIVLKSNLNKKVKILLNTILIILPILVGLSRIYLGAHFASDVIGGAILSLALLLLECYFIDKKEII